MTPLRQRLLEDMQIRHLSPLTQRAYVEHVARFARHVGRSPARLGPEEYTVTLQKAWVVKVVIPAPTVPDTLPVVLSAAEVVRCLDSVSLPTHRTILTTNPAV